MESELWLAHFVKLLHRFCYTTLVLSLNRTKPKAFGFLSLFSQFFNAVCFFLQYFPFFKIWWLSSSWACKYPVPSVYFSIHSESYSSIFTAVILTCALHTFLALSFCLLPLLPYLLPFSCCWCFRLHLCHIPWDCSSHTDSVLTASSLCFFFLAFSCALFSWWRRLLVLHSSFCVIFSSLHFFLCPLFLLLKKWNFCTSCLIARSWFFVFYSIKESQQYLFTVYCFVQHKPKSDPHNSCFVNLLNIGSKG